MTRRIDAHHHLWTAGSGRHPMLDGPPVARFWGSSAELVRDYPVGTFAAQAGAAGVVASVYVEAAFVPAAEEAGAVQAIADAHGFPHAILTRIDLAAFLQSPLGKSVAQLDPSARRHELPFLLRFDIAPHIATVSGQIDLVYWHDDAPVILDYKHAHAADTPANAYTTQLDAYAYAVAELCAYDGPIRTQLVFLKDPHTSKAKVRERTVTAAMRKEFREAALNTMSFLTQ